MLLACAWFVGGLFVDGWAHINVPGLETFFTPWHGLFYSGFFATLALLGWGVGRGRAAGFGRFSVRAIPAGYELSLLGAAVFIVGGFGDMLWHIAFGIEADIEALLSPTHLMLASGMLLVITGPARAAWQRARHGRLAEGWAAQLPMLVSLAYGLALLRFFTQYSDPLSSAFASLAWQPLGAQLQTTAGHAMKTSELFQIPMLAGGLLQSALLVGVLLLAMRSARLPFGAVTLLVALPTALMLLMRQRFDADVRGAVMLAVTLAGLAGDVLMARLRPGFDRPQRLRLFGALLPALVYAAYYLAVAAVGGVWWSIHLWSGAVFLSGVAGWLVALLATPQQAAPQPAEGAAGQLAALGRD
jgi:hypothetical protein